MLGQTSFRFETIGLRSILHFCLCAVWGFMPAIIPSLSAEEAEAASLLDHVITESFEPDGTCTKPVRKTSFETTDSKIYSWVHLSDASPLDRVTWRWIDPESSVYATVPWTVGVEGSVCAAAWMAISGQAAANKTGNWKAEIYLGNTLAATDTFSIGVSNPSDPPKVTFSPPETEILMGGEFFNLVIHIESYSNPLVTGFSMFYNDMDITQSFFAWLDAGVVLVSIAGNLIDVTFPNISLPAGQHKISVIVGNPNGNTTATWSMNMVNPKYSLSATQQEIINQYGNPDYLSLLLNTDQLRREETWTYVALGKTYLFWDGVKVGEKSVGVDANLNASPPKVDPSLFTEKTTTDDLIKLFGNNYTISDVSTFDSELASMDLKTYHFIDHGVLATFAGNQLVAVQTIDVSIAANRTGIIPPQVSSYGDLDLYISNEGTTKIDPLQAIVWAIAVAGEFYGFTDNTWNQFNDLVGGCLRYASQCKDAIKNIVGVIGTEKASEMANLGFQILAGTSEFIDTAQTDCDADPPYKTEGITCTQKCEYTYSPFSDCQPDNTQTRTVLTKTPDGCSGKPDLTKSCIYQPPACKFTYSDWSECQADGTKTRTYTKYPDGCVGEPTEPLVQSCTPTQECVTWDYGEWSECQPDGYQYRTAKGYPDGCVGSPPEELAKACTPTQECVAWDYSEWSECQPDGYQYRNVIKRYPEGCVGDGETVSPCDYHPPCTGYDYTDSGCQQSNLYGPGLGAITRTYRGIPEGCVGGVNVPQTEYICCSLDPC